VLQRRATIPTVPGSGNAIVRANFTAGSARLADFSAPPTLGTRSVRENVGHACHQLPLFHSNAPMKFTEKLSLWGVAHAAARNAERAAAQQAGEPSDNLHREARILRERADRLHREVYMELGPRRADQPSANS
jgi:hypothetical protein